MYSTSRGNYMIETHADNKPYESILENINEEDVKSQASQDKFLLVKKLNESLQKNAKLEKKIQEMRMNRTDIFDAPPV